MKMEGADSIGQANTARLACGICPG